MTILRLIEVRFRSRRKSETVLSWRHNHVLCSGVLVVFKAIVVLVAGWGMRSYGQPRCEWRGVVGAIVGWISGR